ncbi:MAG TPA: hypothetical protein VEJ20_07140, partial [Candidatus Eremiobacteraceae bacterium]|nr:hypothetical protein [Candidatus Eremiobacteraceae bacterium]
NAGAVFFLVALVNSIILALRGPDSISGPLSAYTLPGLGMLANPSNMKLAMFLTFFNVGYLWGFIVVGIALVNLLKIKPVTATILTIVIALLTDALLAALAR